MRSNTSVVTRKGQVTIPAEIRKELNIKEGDRIIFLKRNGSIELLTPEEIIRRTAGVFRPKDGTLAATIEELKEAAAAGWVEEALADQSR